MIEMPTCNTFTNNWKMKQLANVLVACSNIATYMAIHQYVLQHPNACFFSSYVFICSSMFVLQFPSFFRASCAVHKEHNDILDRIKA